MDVDQVVKKIGEYWDIRSQDFDKDHDTEIISQWEKTLEYLLGADKKKSILDLGTGTGFLANLTAKLGYASVGVDISEEMLRLAVKHAKEKQVNAVYMMGNVLELPFLEDTFDFIINCRLIWTLVEADKAIQEWKRVIKPGGKILCFNRMQEEAGLTVFKENFYENELVDKELKIKTASMKELTALLERNGLEKVKIEKLPQMTRPEFHYEPWFVLMGTKPKTLK